MSSILQRRQFSVLAFVFQLLFVILFGLFCSYNNHALPDPKSRIYVNTDYPLFQDIHVMVFVGFGFLMAFLKRYGFSAISVNLLLSAFVAQLSMLIRGLLTEEFRKTSTFTISIEELMAADLSCVPVLVTMGVLLGRFTPVQFLFLALVETIIGTVLEHVLFNILHINDGGRALATHAFGAYFGLACSMACGKRLTMDLDERGSIAHSDLFSMIGTLFLWIFFPSFNASAQEPEDARHRAIMNTYLAMTSCTVTVFLLSSLTDKLGRFNMIHIQNSTLSGGVAIGAVANVILAPYHAMIVGIIGGIVSVFGHVFLSARLVKHLNMYDTCGVHNLHGLPALLSGFFSIFFVLIYDPTRYGSSIYHIYPYYSGGPKKGDRDAHSQALAQLAGIAVTLASAILGGVFSGLILRLRAFNQVDDPRFPHGEIDYYGSEYQHAARR